MNWDIIPYKSVGPLRFGMSPDDVERILGKAESVQGNPVPRNASEGLQDKYAGYTTEFRIGEGPDTIKPSLQYNNAQLVSIEIYDSIKNVDINGYFIFNHSKMQCIEKLKEISINYAITPDSIIFLDLGVSLSIDDEWEYSPSINVFAKGEFDDFIRSEISTGEIEIISK